MKPDMSNIKENLGDIKKNLDFPDKRRSDSLKGNLILV